MSILKLKKKKVMATWTADWFSLTVKVLNEKDINK